MHANGQVAHSYGRLQRRPLSQPDNDKRTRTWTRPCDDLAAERECDWTWKPCSADGWDTSAAAAASDWRRGRHWETDWTWACATPVSDRACSPARTSGSLADVWHWLAWDDLISSNASSAVDCVWFARKRLSWMRRGAWYLDFGQHWLDRMEHCAVVWWNTMARCARLYAFSDFVVNVLCLYSCPVVYPSIAYFLPSHFCLSRVETVSSGH